MATKITQNKVSRKTRATSAKKPGVRIRKENRESEIALYLRQYAPIILLVFFAVLTGVLLFFSYRAVTATSVFNLKKIDVSGTNRVDAEDVREIVRRTATKTGVWNAELEDIRTEIEKLGWVKSAVVSRVLPDGVRARVFEKIPKAIVKTDGKAFWVDEEGNKLGAIAEKDAGTIVLQGWDNENPNTDSWRKQNRERLGIFLKLQEDLKKDGLLNRVKAINIEDLQNIKVIIAIGETNQIPIHLGKEDFVKRLEDAVLAVDGYAKSGEIVNFQYFISREGSISAVPKAAENSNRNKSDK